MFERIKPEMRPFQKLLKNQKMKPPYSQLFNELESLLKTQYYQALYRYY